MRRAATALSALVALAACAPEADPSLTKGAPVDSALVDVLASVHLADARAALAPDSLGRAALADSLHHAALAAHGVTPAAWERRLAALAADPEAAVAVYDALDARLALERPAPDPSASPF